MAVGSMERNVVVVLNIGKTLIPSTNILRFIHVQDVHNHLIEDLCLAIGLRMEGSGFSGLGVEQSLETREKCVEEPDVMIINDGL